MKVAIVWNNGEGQVVNRFGQPCPEKYGRGAVERVAEGLREGGHQVEVLEGDVRLFESLRRFLLGDPLDRVPMGMVFNMAYGIQGECRYTHVPAMLEMAGIPYSGSSPLGHALALDKVITKQLIRESGVPTPDWLVAASPEVDPGPLRFPLIVKPRHESTSFGLRVVHHRDELREAVRDVLVRYDQDALVEEFIAGREVCIGLLGNGRPSACHRLSWTLAVENARHLRGKTRCTKGGTSRKRSARPNCPRVSYAAFARSPWPRSKHATAGTTPGSTSASIVRAIHSSWRSIRWLRWARGIVCASGHDCRLHVLLVGVPDRGGNLPAMLSRPCAGQRGR